MLSTPLHSGSLFPPLINWTQPDTHPHLDARSAPYHLHQSASQAISTKSVYEVHVKKEKEEERTSIIECTYHCTINCALHRDYHKLTPLHTTSPSAASTVPQCPPATKFPKPTRKSLTFLESRLWHRHLAHIHPTALRSLIDGYSKDNLMCTACIQAKHKQKIIKAI